jgi:death-on-curing protein
MGTTSRAIVFPTHDDIVEINRYHIESTGGFHDGGNNIINLGSLKWVLDAIQHPLFGVDQYPSIAEKAAILSWKITAGHVFFDGNKRTGTSALLIFLQANGYRLDASHDDIIDMMLHISSPEKEIFDYEDYVEWIRDKIAIITK